MFQRHTKAAQVDDESYLLTLCHYIHQNSVRVGIVKKQEDWEFSSYRDYAGLRQTTLIEKELLQRYYTTAQQFKTSSEEILKEVKQQYWI